MQTPDNEEEEMKTLGIDSSTQSIKALVYDAETQAVAATASVNFGKELPEFGSPDGFLPDAGGCVRQADPLMWLAGLDRVLAKLQAVFDTSQIDAVGGDGQQHGSVYLGAKWPEALASLDTARPLAEQIAPCLSRKVAPIWMDSSTGEECRALDARFGENLRLRTGSPAIERFTGPQIMKFAKESPAAYVATARIHLVSSFLCSVLAGKDAPIDTGDGAGMNLLNLETLSWDAEICGFAAPGLAARLPRIARPGENAGMGLSPYFGKYGFRAGIPVVPFTGDNPASLVGVGADRPGVAVVSLGTSDVFFAAMDGFRTDPAGCGHVFGNPSGGFMCLACVKNGSLAREKIRSQLGADYRFFDETAFELTPPGNGGKRAFPFFESEITPVHAATGIEANFDWDAAAPEVKVRAVIEGQVANLFERTRWIGEFDTIRVTGGASRSKGLRDAIAAIFGARVETLDVPDSAALGGAVLAARAIAKRGKV